MINNTSFSPKLYSQLKIIIGIQKDLSNIRSNNIDEIASIILTKKEIIESQSGVLLLSQCFNDVADFNPKNIESLADLFIFLQNSKSDTNYLHLLKDYVVLCIHTREKLRSSVLFFLRTLLIRNAISIDSIINEINLMPPQSLYPELNNKKHQNTTKLQNDTKDNDNITSKGQSEEQDEITLNDENFYQKNLKKHSLTLLLEKKHRVINWFYYEIQENNEQIIQKAVSQFYYMIPLEFKQEDQQAIKQIMNTGYSTNQIAKVIREDDIDSFLTIVKELGTKFDVNQTIESSKFERCYLLSNNPTLIQYASFFNSIKIFKYLFLNHADIHSINNKVHSISHFAISGGSFEIIHILEQNEVDFINGISIAIRFYQNEIFSWILENHPPKSSLEFDSINFYLSNILKNHSFYHSFDFMEKVDDGDGNENDSYHNQFYFYKSQYTNNNYGYNSDDSDNENDDDDDDDNDKFFDDDFFIFFDFDFIFQSILESNNYLALFLLFDHGMNINARNQNSKKTLLHFAIQKGKIFLFKLLFSNKFIDLSLRDKEDQAPIIYTLKYKREKMFFLMIKNQKVLDSLTDLDYILLSYYADFCGLKNCKNYIMSIWKINLILLMEIEDIKTFCKAMDYLPLSSFYDQIELFLNESFKTRKFEYFCIFANRVLREKSLNLKGKFYFVPSKIKKDMAKEFRDLCSLLAYYGNYNKYQKIKFYSRFKRNLNQSNFHAINYQYYSDDFKENEYFTYRFENNVIVLYCLNDLKATQYSEISIKNHKNDDNDVIDGGDDQDKKQKKKKSNNKPLICVD